MLNLYKKLHKKVSYPQFLCKLKYRIINIKKNFAKSKNSKKVFTQ